MTLMLLIVFSLFGLIVGSFLNVVIYRFNTDRSLGGRSGCMVCQSKLAWYDLVPVLSFVALKGRCRSCSTKISTQYPLVEISSAIIFGLIFWKFQDLFYTDILIFSFTYSYYVTLFSILLVITVYDIKHKIIPDGLAFIFGAFAFVGMFFFDTSSFGSVSVFYPHIPSLAEFLGSFAIAIPFAGLWFFSRGAWMGLGDGKLAIGLGFMLGLGKLLSAAVLSFWSGAIIGLILVAIKRTHNMKSEIPFGPFLVLGAFLAFIFELNLFQIF
ncbi:MAG: prepilin peptidase [bacterium]|nr:prepilin peptidase [bacterium]